MHPAIALMIIVVIVITVIPLAVWFAERPFEVTSNAQVLLIIAAIVVVSFVIIKFLTRSPKRPP